MSPIIVASCYGSAAVLSLFLLWQFGVKRWYWHALSIAAAFGIGLTPLSEPWNRPDMTLVIGWFFVALLVWGLAAPIFLVLQGPFHFHFKHH